MFPQPSSIGAALALVVGKRLPRTHQQTGVAIGPQCRVNFVDIAFAGFDGQPLNQLARKPRVDLPRLGVLVLVDKNDIEVAAVAQLFATPFAIAQHRKTGQDSVLCFQARPNPQSSYFNQGVSQQTQIICDLLHAQTTLYIARQCQQGFAVVRAAQHIEQAFLVVCALAGKGVVAGLQMAAQLCGVKAFVQHLGVCQLVNHPWVRAQITRCPACRPQQPQQLLVYLRALKQQSQIGFAPQQRFHPVAPAQSSLFVDEALVKPSLRTLHQAQQSLTGVFAQGQHPRQSGPSRHTFSKQG